jgi:hypothetical protein
LRVERQPLELGLLPEQPELRGLRREAERVDLWRWLHHKRDQRIERLSLDPRRAQALQQIGLILEAFGDCRGERTRYRNQSAPVERRSSRAIAPCPAGSGSWRIRRRPQSHPVVRRPELSPLPESALSALPGTRPHRPACRC